MKRCGCFSCERVERDRIEREWENLVAGPLAGVGPPTPPGIMLAQEYIQAARWDWKSERVLPGWI